ncbi:cytochrome P450 [Streptomyces rimosus]|uniref:cytochrome P450 n=1 Tax=Streptomyces rimosus TaxID=1927 RepID=UPI000AF8B483|nr:cytochrome P450 [Streptomyces rimosus]
MTSTERASTATATATGPAAAQELEIARACPYSPNAQHIAFQRQGRPVKVTLATLAPGAPVWAVSNHADIRTMLNDARFSADRQQQGFPFQVDGQPGNFRRTMISMDGAEHREVRRSVTGEFTLKRMKALQPRIQQIVDDCIDTMLAGPKPADLVSALALPVPSLVICEQLGVPYEGHDFFQSRSHMLLLRGASAEERLRALDELIVFLGDLITEKEAEPTDDLLGRQIVKLREAGTYRHQDLARMAFLLLVAGHETTANMISLGTMALLDRPADAGALRADPSKLPVAVEELLRYFTIAEFIPTRVATEDVELGGSLIKAGDVLVALCNVANRDPSVFPAGDTLDLQRGARHQLAFGFGAHQCLGQNLARMELEIVYSTLLRRIPTLRSAIPTGELPFKHDADIYGIHAFPVTW